MVSQDLLEILRCPACMRKADDETIIVAAGTSCRHQIEDGTGKQALHTTQVLRQAIEVKNES